MAYNRLKSNDPAITGLDTGLQKLGICPLYSRLKG